MALQKDIDFGKLNFAVGFNRTSAFPLDANSYFEDYNPKEGSIPLKYLSKSLELLADADVAYFCSGWDTARGCRIEHQCAVEYGIDRIFD